uniref:Nucleic-acid-binding protein from transposon X-element n=1 Tax=Heterorhabditis bacteriophora TaxID=37862 RepID=A0A1I7WY01_HETBA
MQDSIKKIQLNTKYSEVLASARKLQHALATRRAETNCQYELAKFRMEMTNTHTVSGIAMIKQLSQVESKDIVQGKSITANATEQTSTAVAVNRCVVRTHVDKCYIPKIPRHYSGKNIYDKSRKKTIYGTIGARSDRNEIKNRIYVQREIRSGKRAETRGNTYKDLISQEDIVDKNCIFCGGHHNSVACRKLADSYNRRQILIEKRAPSCSKCRGEHHNTVCSRMQTEHIRSDAENRNRHSQNRSNEQQRNVGPPYAGTGQNTLPPILHRPSPMMQRPGEENFIQKTYDNKSVTYQ